MTLWNVSFACFYGLTKDMRAPPHHNVSDNAFSQLCEVILTSMHNYYICSLIPSGYSV